MADEGVHGEVVVVGVFGHEAADADLAEVVDPAAEFLHGVVEGVGVLVDQATGNPIFRNSIFQSGGLGISLVNGGNSGQAAPAVTSVTTVGGTTTIGGTLSSVPSKTFRIELFRSPACDASGKGEGRLFIGATTVATNGSGNGSFSKNVPAQPAGQQITATATNVSTKETSAFSACRATP